MVIGSIVVLVLAVWLGRWLTARFGTWTATLLAGAAAVVVLGVLMLVLPSFGQLAANKPFGNQATETPLPLRDPAGNIVYPGFPADVLFNFRLYSVGAQLLLWTTIGLCFAPLAERLLRPESGEAREHRAVTA